MSTPTADGAEEPAPARPKSKSKTRKVMEIKETANKDYLADLKACQDFIPRFDQLAVLNRSASTWSIESRILLKNGSVSTANALTEIIPEKNLRDGLLDMLPGVKQGLDMLQQMQKDNICTVPKTRSTVNIDATDAEFLNQMSLSKPMNPFLLAVEQAVINELDHVKGKKEVSPQGGKSPRADKKHVTDVASTLLDLAGFRDQWELGTIGLRPKNEITVHWGRYNMPVAKIICRPDFVIECTNPDLMRFWQGVCGEAKTRVHYRGSQATTSLQWLAELFATGLVRFIQGGARSDVSTTVYNLLFVGTHMNMIRSVFPPRYFEQYGSGKEHNLGPAITCFPSEMPFGAKAMKPFSLATELPGWDLRNAEDRVEAFQALAGLRHLMLTTLPKAGEVPSVIQDSSFGVVGPFVSSSPRVDLPTIRPTE